MAQKFNTISFLSDYGQKDEFVGVVHSVIRSIAPHARVIDITHGIAPQGIRAGALALARAASYLSPGVVLAVVDPTVGTSRRAIAIEVGDGASYLVGPDNGIFGPIVGLVGGATRAIELTSTDHRLPSAGGSTFDGRDIFAPAAAHICNGVSLSKLGTPISIASLMPTVIPVSQKVDNQITAEVIWVDHYGNCQLNVDPADIADFTSTLTMQTLNATTSGMVVASYSEIPVGRAGLLVDSSGLLSIAVANGSAAAEFDIHEGDEVTLTPSETDNSQRVGITPRNQVA